MTGMAGIEKMGRGSSWTKTHVMYMHKNTGSRAQDRRFRSKPRQASLETKCVISTRLGVPPYHPLLCTYLYGTALYVLLQTLYNILFGPSSRRPGI